MTYTDRVAAELRAGCTHNGRPCYCQVGLSIALRRPVAELFPTDQEDPVTTPDLSNMQIGPMPTHITHAQMVAACEALGLDPKTTRELRIDYVGPGSPYSWRVVVNTWTPDRRSLIATSIPVAESNPDAEAPAGCRVPAPDTGWGHGDCPCRKTGVHRVHRCEHGTEWWERTAQDAATAPADPGEGDGTGGGLVDAHRGAEGVAVDAAANVAAC